MRVAVAFLLLAMALQLPATLPAQGAELRSVWIARDGLTSRAKIRSTLDQLAAANVNVVAVVCWSRGYTIHPSDVLAAACGQQQDPDYVGRDPLQEVVIEAHRRGMEVEAWFEYGFMFGWSGWYAGPGGTGPVLAANPSWVARDASGNSQVADGAGGFFTWAVHEHPAVRQFLIDLAVEVVDRYDVDGVQFDRVRYPSTAFGYDATTAAAYQAATGQPPPTNPNQSQWKRWRADGLIAFHQQLYAAIKARRASVRVTDAPTVMPGAYDNFLQDWPAWVVGGSIDLIYPQVYRTTASAYVTTLDQQLATLPMAWRNRVAPGIRAISGTPTAEVLAMVAANRARGLPGQVFWYAEGLYDDLPALAAQYFQAPAAVPLQPAGWRPPAGELEELAATTVTAGFLPLTLPAASGGQARLALASAAPTDRVLWTLPVAETGLWSLVVHEPGGAGMATAVPHAVATAAGPAVLRVDQSVAPAAWQEVGTLWLAQGQTTVELRAVPGQVVVADAVGLLRSRLPSGPMGTIGAGTPGSAGGLLLSLWGRAGLGGRIVVQASQAPVAAPVALLLGLTGAAVPLFGGVLYVVPEWVEIGVADAAGLVAVELPVPFTPSLLGTTLWAQGLALDAGGPGGLSLSPGAAATLQ